MTVYGPGCDPQNIIWTEAKLRSIYYVVGYGHKKRLVSKFLNLAGISPNAK